MGGRRRVRAELLAHLIEGKLRLCMDYAPKDIMQDLELELGIRLTYMKSWRAREFVRMMVLGRPDDHYKLLPLSERTQGQWRSARLRV